MMTRASRLLKWVGAGAVLLAAAPIAYADGTGHIGSLHSSHAGEPGDASARCGGALQDFAGAYTAAGAAGTRWDFRADGTMSALYFGRPALSGTWRADGGRIVWNVDGHAYTSAPGTAVCADPADGSRVTSVTAASADGSDTVTLRRS
jgi:hypothetical protein